MSTPSNSDTSLNRNTPILTEGNKFALVVGVNNCVPSYLSTLEIAEDDAQNVCWALRQPSCSFKSVNLLTGDKARTSDVRAAMISMIQEKTDQDFLLFYFIGHGQPMRTKDGYCDIYFATHDFDPNQVKVDANIHLCMRWLRDTLYEADGVGSVLIVLDCCYAGNMITSKPDTDHIKIDVDVRQIVNEVVGEHLGEAHVAKQRDRLRVILTSTRHNKQAQERVMTSLLFPVLQGKEPGALDPNTGDVNIHSLFNYLQYKISHDDLPNLKGEFPRKCILASYPEKSHQNLELARKTKDNQRWDELPTKVKEQVEEAMSEVMAEFMHFVEHTDLSSSQSFDHSLCTQASIKDLDSEKISRFFRRERFLKEKSHLVELSEQERLVKFGLMNESYPYPTYGALLCFGNDTQHWVSSALTRCIKWADNDRLDNRLFDGDLLSQFERSREFLQTHLDFTEIITSEGATNQYEIPLRALEEVLTNALVHREYKDQKSFVQIQIFDDRVEISSPGEHPLATPINTLGKDTTSHPRNFQIASIFYLYGYIQEAGSGIPRIRRLMEAAGLPAPEFKLNPAKMFTVVLYRPKKYRHANDRVGQQVKNYWLTHFLSKSSSAEVYLGEQVTSRSPVVIKILQMRLSRDNYKNFFDETAKLSLLVHPNIVRVIDFFVQENTPILVMEYAPNGTLRIRHKRNERLPLNSIISYVNQIALALQYMHGHNQFHRNIKPENILIGPHGEVMLSGFGISVKTQNPYFSQEEEVDNLAYMAPENFSGEFSAASDQYALGMIVYEWLNGSRPVFDSFEVAFQDGNIPPNRENDTPYAIEQVVMKALEKEPKNRFDNILAFASALKEAGQFILSQKTNKESTLPLQPKLKVTSSLETTSVPGLKEANMSNRNLFEVDRNLLRVRKYRVFRIVVILLNIVTSLLLGLWFQSWVIGLVCLVLTSLLFILCVILVRRSTALLVATAFSLIWGIVGWVLVSIILSVLPEKPFAFLLQISFEIPVAAFCFLFSLFLGILYVQNKSLR